MLLQIGSYFPLVSLLSVIKPKSSGIDGSVLGCSLEGELVLTQLSCFTKRSMFPTDVDADILWVSNHHKAFSCCEPVIRLTVWHGSSIRNMN